MDIHLMENAVLTDEQCKLCGATFHCDTVVAFVYGPVGMSLEIFVCPACIAAGPDGLRERMRTYAAELRAHADNLDLLASGPINMPTPRDVEIRRTMLDDQIETALDEE